MESKDLKKFQASAQASRARFAISFFMAGSQCWIVCAARAMRLLFSHPCQESERQYAWRFHEDLGLETLEELEVAAHDGRIENYPGIGAKRLAGIRDSLAQRLGRIRRQPAAAAPPAPQKPPVSELLDVDREYRNKAAAGTLKKIAPHRFNPEGESWLPIMHTARKRPHSPS